MNPLLERPNIYNTCSNEYIEAGDPFTVCVIEMGRHHKVRIPKEHRLCSCGDVEDEEHFIMTCHQYSHIRNGYFPTPTSFDDPRTAMYIFKVSEERKL